MPPNSTNPNEGMPKEAKIWFWLIVGALVLVVGVMFGLVVWRDYQAGDGEGAVFTLAIPLLLLLLLFYGSEKLGDRLAEMPWTEVRPRLWKSIKNVVDISAIIPFFVVFDMEKAQPWRQLIGSFLWDCLVLTVALYVVFGLFDLIKDWYHGRI